MPTPSPCPSRPAANPCPIRTSQISSSMLPTENAMAAADNCFGLGRHLVDLPGVYDFWDLPLPQDIPCCITSADPLVDMYIASKTATVFGRLEDDDRIRILQLSNLNRQLDLPARTMRFLDPVCFRSSASKKQRLLVRPNRSLTPRRRNVDAGHPPVSRRPVGGQHDHCRKCTRGWESSNACSPSRATRFHVCCFRSFWRSFR